MSDIVIIGAGTAGLSAAIYVQRAGKSALVIEGANYGGQIIGTSSIENYPGIKQISGFDFATDLYNQAKDLGAQFAFEKVEKVEDLGDEKVVYTNKNEYHAKAVIIATGMIHRELGIDRDQELKGKGISFCATCDGMFFKGKDVAVVGGGNVAIEDAEYLTRFCNRVYLIHRRDAFRADDAEVRKLDGRDNLVKVMNSTVTKLIGEDRLQAIEVVDKVTGKSKELSVDALFVAIGQIPSNQIFENLVDLDDYGFIRTDENCKTSRKGIFAVGDCRAKTVRQLTTAASDGAIAALNACNEM
ncbi:MAG: thioredoxin-disulfide reductase [Erysipelotrichaceae bacterium]|nr:thioredoxin-disulfide reductase [Erysipelotrichaceae bacterium]MDY6035822.1 thioredoxin-disulfide reductase [Bulleidia sp.]